VEDGLPARRQVGVAGGAIWGLSPGNIGGIPDGLAMYRVGTVDCMSLFATRDKAKSPSAAVAPPGAASLAVCPGVLQ
jgi:hypothetical protein